MITFYREEKCFDCDEMQETLRDMVAAYQMGNTAELAQSQRKKLPLLLDGDKEISGHTAIRRFIEELKKVMMDWQKFQSDSCYLDDQGKVC